jgi:hypothetical protein
MNQIELKSPQKMLELLGLERQEFVRSLLE